MLHAGVDLHKRSSQSSGGFSHLARAPATPLAVPPPSPRRACLTRLGGPACRRPPAPRGCLTGLHRGSTIVLSLSRLMSERSRLEGRSWG